MECQRGLATRKLFVRRVRSFVKRVHCDKTQDRSVQILHHTEDHLA